MTRLGPQGEQFAGRGAAPLILDDTSEPQDGPPDRQSTVDQLYSHNSMTLKQRIKESTENVIFPSSLDFERVVNQYSIQATRDRYLVVGDSDWPGPVSSDLHGSKEDLNPLLHPSDKVDAAVYSTFDSSLGRADAPLPPPGLSSSLQGSAQKLGEKVESEVWKVRPKNDLLGYTHRTATRWILTIITGLMTGVIAIAIVSATQRIESWRSDQLDSLWKSNQLSWIIFAIFASVNLSLALLSSLLCLLFAPQAIGSGIPEVKAYLNGVRVHRFTDVRLFVVKILGTILSVPSGLVIGPEGPLVHTGAILGASCTKLYDLLLHILPKSCFANERTIWSVLINILSHFAHDDERRDLVSIGAAAGFAAAFGAPIGGLLFSLEEASSWFDQRMFVKTLTATALATFLLAVHHGNLSNYSIISLGDFHTPNQKIFLNRVAEIPLYVLTAVVGGILGGIFVRSWTALQLFRQRVFHREESRRQWSLFQVTLVSLTTSSLMYYVPLMKWTCRRVDVNDDLVEDESIFDEWKFHPHQFDCPDGYINELATIFFGSREDTISAILTDPRQFKPATLWCVGIMFFVLMNVTIGVAIPSGIFMPTFLIGSSLGGAAGMAFGEWLGTEISPSTFALLGAAALLAGIQRSTVSLCVILVEGTGQVKILLPVIITVVTARYAAGFVTEHGLYEAAMEISHYPYLEHAEDKKLDMFKVQQIMSAPPVSLEPRERAQSLVRILKETVHNGFPIVSGNCLSSFSRRPLSNTSCSLQVDPFTKKFLGLVRRDQIVALIENGVYDDGYVADDDSVGSMPCHDSSRVSPDWTPRPGVGKSPLMHSAYHITDGRYDFVDETNFHMVSKSLSQQDIYDSRAWLESVRANRAKLDG